MRRESSAAGFQAGAIAPILRNLEAVSSPRQGSLKPTHAVAMVEARDVDMARRDDERRPGPQRAGLMRRFSRDRGGVAAIEFAILAIPFFLLVFALLETALVFFGELSLDRAVEEVARGVRVGRYAAASEGEFRADLCKEVQIVMDCTKLAVDLRSYDSFADLPKSVRVTDGAEDTSGFGYEQIPGNTIAALRVTYHWPIVTDLIRKSLSDLSDGTHLIAATAAFKTEPF